MIDFFQNIYSAIPQQDSLLTKLRFYSLVRVLIRIVANITLPLYFIISSHCNKYRLHNQTTANHKSPKIIVSITCFPARISRVWLTIESVLRQKLKPDLIYLFLSKEQFQSLDILPKSLLRLQHRGLNIILCDDDLRAHKKYFYGMQMFPNDYIITLDDDVMYSSEIIAELVDHSKTHPNAICCNRCLLISTENQQIAPYLSWKGVKIEHAPSYNLFATGVGGVLYPPQGLSNHLFDTRAIKETCLLADDIWLNAMAQMNGTKTSRTKNKTSLFLPILFLKNVTLTSVNVDGGENDVQIQKVRSYCIDNFGEDPYAKILNDNI